jgi:hypothetical protein
LSDLPKWSDENLRKKTTFSPIVVHTFSQTAPGKRGSAAQNRLRLG